MYVYCQNQLRVWNDCYLFHFISEMTCLNIYFHFQILKSCSAIHFNKLKIRRRNVDTCIKKTKKSSVSKYFYGLMQQQMISLKCNVTLNSADAQKLHFFRFPCFATSIFIKQCGAEYNNVHVLYSLKVHVCLVPLNCTDMQTCHYMLYKWITCRFLKTDKII